MGPGHGTHSFQAALEAAEVIWGWRQTEGWLAECCRGGGSGETTRVRGLVGVGLAEFNAAITVRLFIGIKH